jgi:myo-inositol-1(or 4)-monophosphatase
VNADLELAERAARAAGAVLLERYGRPPEGLESKSSATDPVSDADREAERTIRELLRGERPDDGLLGEEGSHSDARSGRRWVVDPLDGTVNFLYGFPAWGVSVALEDAGGGLAGVVLDPVGGELFRCARGAGAELVTDGAGPPRGGGPLAVRDPVGLADALVATGFAYGAEQRAIQAQIAVELLPRVRDIRRAGAAALDLCSVAAGRVDAFYERGLKAWDRAAGVLLVEEAGGTVLELPGEPAGLVAASSAELARDILALVT